MSYKTCEITCKVNPLAVTFCSLSKCENLLSFPFSTCSNVWSFFLYLRSDKGVPNKPRV